MAVELVNTTGIFALDGGEWEVTNNIWIVGNEREVLVVDAAHDHEPIVAAVNGKPCHLGARFSAMFGQPSNHGPGLAVCHQDLLGLSFLNGGEQSRPVRMIRQREASIDRLPESISSSQHPA